MNLFSSLCELYSHHFLWKKISIPSNILYPRIKFNKPIKKNLFSVTFYTRLINGNKYRHIYISIILFLRINKYNLKQTHIKKVGLPVVRTIVSKNILLIFFY